MDKRLHVVTLDLVERLCIKYGRLGLRGVELSNRCLSFKSSDIPDAGQLSDKLPIRYKFDRSLSTSYMQPHRGTHGSHHGPSHK